MAVAGYVEDVVLVDRCLGGEAAATRELFRTHRRRVHACLYRVLGSNTELDDLMQDAFLQVFSSLRSWRAEASLATFIDRITVRVAYRYLGQKRRRVPAISLLDEHVQSSLAPNSVARHQARAAVRRLYEVLSTMSPATRLAFTLHELEGRSMAEVGALLGSSVTATKVRVWRARRTIDAAAATDAALKDFLTRGEVPL